MLRCRLAERAQLQLPSPLCFADKTGVEKLQQSISKLAQPTIVHKDYSQPQQHSPGNSFMMPGV